MGRRSYAGGGIFNIEEDEISHVDVMCYGASTGSLAVIVHGGVPPYQFSIDGVNWQNEEYFDNLPVPSNAIKSTDEYGGIWIGEYTMYCKDARGQVRMVKATMQSPVERELIINPNNTDNYDNGTLYFAADAGKAYATPLPDIEYYCPAPSTIAGDTQFLHTVYAETYNVGSTTMRTTISSRGCRENDVSEIPIRVSPRLLPNAVQDYDGNWYDAVIIGSKVWLGHNFIGTKAANGNSLGYKNPYNNQNYVPTYGRYYEFYTYKNNTFINGWHSPTNAEWDEMIAYVASQSVYVAGGVAGNVAKALAIDSGWKASDVAYSPGNTPEDNNLTYFSAKPCGGWSGVMFNIDWAIFWGSEFDATYGRVYLLKYNSPASENQILSKSSYSSVRLVCDMNALDFIKWYWNTYGSFDHQLS